MPSEQREAPASPAALRKQYALKHGICFSIHNVRLALLNSLLNNLGWNKLATKKKGLHPQHNNEVLLSLSLEGGGRPVDLNYEAVWSVGRSWRQMPEARAWALLPRGLWSRWHQLGPGSPAHAHTQPRAAPGHCALASVTPGVHHPPSHAGARAGAAPHFQEAGSPRGQLQPHPTLPAFGARPAPALLFLPLS